MKRKMVIAIDYDEDSNGKKEYYMIIRGFFPITKKREIIRLHNKLYRTIKQTNRQKSIRHIQRQTSKQRAS